MPEPDSDADADRLAALTTEAVDDAGADLDRRATIDLVLAMNDADAAVPLAVRSELSAIAAAVDGIAERMARGGRLVYAGAGTAGRIGILDASEAPPTFGTEPGRVVGLIAGGRDAMFEAAEGAEDDADAGGADIAALVIGPDDSVVGLSASGRTPYVVGALREARRRGALTVAVACNRGSEIGAIVDIAIEVEVGPEIVSGSTRLKSATAQKLVVNMLSTLAMIRLGKTYGNLMVDLRVTNRKLRARAERTVARLTGASPDAVRGALDATGDSVKEAALMLRTGLGPDEVRAVLARHDGNLRAASDSLR